MGDLFLKLLNLSFSASVLVVVVVILRLVLKKAPRWVAPVLWGIVAVRLLCPVSIESVLSLLPSAQPIPADIAMAQRPAIDSGIPAVNRTVNPIITEVFTPDPAASANPLQIWLEIGGWVWLAGMTAMLLYTFVTYLRLRRRVRTAVPMGKNLYQCETVASPFVLGLFRPRIYLPFGLDAENLFYIVAHEKAHIRRRDHIWKPLGFTLLAVHWFNPLLWLAYILLCRDIELACDEKVIRSLGRSGRADYSQALLSCSVSRRSIAACPLAFGEVGVKERVKTVLRYKRPGFWMVFAAVTACVVFAVCFLTNPKKPEIQNGIYSTREVAYQALSTDSVDPHERLKYLTLNPFELRLTPEGELLFRAPGDEVWQIAYGLTKSDLTAEEFNSYTDKLPNFQWQGEPVGTIEKAYMTDSGDYCLYLFLTGEEELYFALRTDPVGYTPQLLYAVRLQLDEIDNSEPAPPLENEWGLGLGLGDGLSTTGTDLFFWGLNQVAEKGTLYCSPGYLLETYENGRWKVLNKISRPDDTREPVNEFFSAAADWSADCGSLPDGRYRLGKRVWLERNDGKTEEDTVYAEFIVRLEGVPVLTREDMLRLLPKGRELVWSDFEEYGRIQYDSPVFHHWSFKLDDGLEVSVNGNRDMRPNNVSLLYDSEPSYCTIGFYSDDYIKAFLKPLPEGYKDHRSAYYGIKMEVSNVSSTGLTLNLKADPPEGLELKSGNQYVLEKKNEYGVWLTVPTLSDAEWETEYFWDDAFQDENIEWIDWTDRYGIQPPGEYRIGKSFRGDDVWSDPFYAEFTIYGESAEPAPDVTISVSEITPEHLVLKYHRSAPGDTLYRMPGFTLEKQTDQGWIQLDVGTWEQSVGDPIDFEWYAQEGNGMFLSWDRIGALQDGHYRLGGEIATDPDLSKAQRINVSTEFTVDTGGWVDGRVPLSQIPANYHPEDAEIDGCLVMTGGIPRSSAREVFAPFREAVDTGTEASLRFVTGYPSEEDPPYEVFVHDLTFDGRSFTLRYLEEGREVVKTYRYLKRFTQPQPEDAVGSYISEWFVLTNDETLTMKTYDPESRVLQQGVSPEHEVIFAEQTFAIRRPEIPADIVKVSLVFGRETCLTLEDPERIEKIQYLFSSAELLGYEPKTHSVGTGLNLVLLTADEETVLIELDVDSDIARMDGEFIWYGAPDEPDHIEKLWYYLGLDAWPDVVYEKYPNCFRGEP